MKRNTPLIIIGAVFVIALLAGYVLIQNNKKANTRPTARLAAAPSTQTFPAHEKGSASSPVTIEEFGDLQCPPCKTLHLELKKIPAIEQGQVRFIFRHYPLSNHAHAVVAASATEAAGLQNKFWEMQDYIYRNQEAWNRTTDAQPIFASYASTLGMDVERFLRDMKSPEVAARIRADQQRGAARGVQSTPTVFFNNRELSPDDFTAARIQTLIDAARAGTQPKN